MAQIRLISLTIERFKHITTPVTLDFQSYGPGLHFFHGENHVHDFGSNGAGKSTLWDALCWCLFGITGKGLKNPDVAPWSGERDTAVALQFTVDGRTCLINRRIHPNKLLLNDKLAAQADIDALLGVSYELFTNTVVISQRETAFIELTPERKLDLFVQALDLERWERRSKLAAEQTARWDAYLVQCQSDLISVKDMINEYSQQLANLLSSQSDFDANNRTVLQTATADRERLQSEIDKLQYEYDGADLIRDGSETEISNIQLQLSENRIELDRLHDQYQTGQGIQEKARGLADYIRTQLAQFETGICPTCRQPIKKEKHKHAIDLRKELDEYNERERLARPSKELITKINTLKRTHDTLTDALANFQSKSHNAMDTMTRLSSPLASIKARHRQLGELITAGGAENPYREQIAAARRTISQKKADAKQLEKAIDHGTAVAERSRYWIKAFRDIRLFVLDDVLRHLEFCTQAALAELGMADWTITFDVEHETKRGTVKRGIHAFIQSPGNPQPVKFEAWSGGEGQRLLVSCTLALADTLLAYAGIDIDFQVLDEPTTSLSVEGIDDMIRWFADRARNRQQILLYADHRIVDNASFDTTTIVLRNRNGVALNQLSH